MNRRQLLTPVAAAAATTAVGLAQRTDRDDEDNVIVGSWFATLTFANPPGEVKALFSFHPRGVLTATARYLVKPTPLGDLMETSGHGAWTSAGNRSFQVFERLFLQSAESGVVIGTDDLRLSLTLDRERQTLTGTFVLQGKDTSGGLMFQAEGRFSAARITV